ncbi:MAG: hypothetical protein IIB61_02520 [Planctomycetes bacterium]|nr:hypothetical protein [Planctomycetota bacterium]
MSTMFSYDWFHGEAFDRQRDEATTRCTLQKFPDATRETIDQNDEWRQFRSELDTRRLVYLRDGFSYEVKELAEIGGTSHLVFECEPVDDQYKVGAFVVAVPCEEFPGPLEECDESTVGGTLNVFDYWWLGGDRHNLSLYEPAGNPSGEAPGIWLGNGVTPSACFNGIQIRRGDAERDGLADACEFALARAFAPYMQFDHGEALVKFPDGTNRHCAEGEPYWAAKLFDEFGVVNIVYMMAYYKDCGEAFIPFDAHSGDSELIRLSVVYNNATQHWELTQAYLSAHAGTRTDASVYAGPSELEYPIRDRAFPKIWVARNKHANYRSFADCENGPDFPAPNTDSCDEDLRYLQARFPVRAGRNVQVGMCVPSLFIPTSTRCEWFMRVPVPFSGWLGGSDVS